MAQSLLPVMSDEGMRNTGHHLQVNPQHTPSTCCSRLSRSCPTILFYFLVLIFWKKIAKIKEKGERTDLSSQTEGHFMSSRCTLCPFRLLQELFNQT